MHTHTHPRSGLPIKGLLLASGALLRPEDKYACSSGRWEICPIPGLILDRTQTVWVRPEARLSDRARTLLLCLTAQAPIYSRYVAQRPWKSYAIVPSAHFNWDPRIETPVVEHPECIQELVDFGYLEYGEYSMPYDGLNCIFALTDLGKSVAAKLKKH